MMYKENGKLASQENFRTTLLRKLGLSSSFFFFFPLSFHLSVPTISFTFCILFFICVSKAPPRDYIGKGKLLLFVFFFYLCSQSPSTWLEHPNRCSFSTFSPQKTYCSHSESRSIHKTFPNFCWSYYNSSLNFFIWYCCLSNNFFYLNNSIKWALRLGPTWFCCFKLLLNYKLQMTSAQILNQSISYFYILVIACPKYFWFLIQNNFAKFGDSIFFF